MVFPPADRAIEARQVGMNRNAISKALGTKKPRGWQITAKRQVMELFKTQDLCVVECVTGGGKTFFASYLAAEFLARGEVDEVVVIAPSTPIKQNWASTMESFSVTCISDNYATSGVIAYAVTYSGCMNRDVLAKVAAKKSRFLIVDEFHHAERDAPWGDAVDRLAAQSKKVLMLTGTPWRSEGEISLLKQHGYYDNGCVKPDFAYKYRTDLDATDDNRATVYVHFSFYDSKARNKATGETVELKTPGDDDEWNDLANENDKRPLGMHVTVGDERLSNNSMAKTMLNEAIAKLEISRAQTKGRAIGLVVARNIREARCIEWYLTELLDQRAEVIASDDERASDRLAEIKNSRSSKSPDWIVSVGMVSEGVDIPQIKVIVYLSGIMTLLYLTQVIGRCMRRINIGSAAEPKYIDKTPSQSPGYVIMPAHPYLLWVALKFEEDRRFSMANKIPKPGPGGPGPGPVNLEWINTGGQSRSECIGGRPQDPMLTKMLEALASDAEASKICNTDFVGTVYQWMKDGELEHAEKELRRYCEQFEIEISNQSFEKQMTTDQEIRWLKSESKKLTAKIRFGHIRYRNRPKSEDGRVYSEIRAEINKSTGIKSFDSATLQQMRLWVQHAQQILREVPCTTKSAAI